MWSVEVINANSVKEFHKECINKWMIACGVTRGYQDAWIGSSLSLAFRRSEKKPTDPSFLMLIAVYGAISVRNKCKQETWQVWTWGPLPLARSWPITWVTLQQSWPQCSPTTLNRSRLNQSLTVLFKILDGRGHWDSHPKASPSHQMMMPAPARGSLVENCRRRGRWLPQAKH